MIIKKFSKFINNSNINKLLKVEKKLFLLTLHRQENVDNEFRLKFIISVLKNITKTFNLKIVWPTSKNPSKHKKV